MTLLAQFLVQGKRMFLLPFCTHRNLRAPWSTQQSKDGGSQADGGHT